MSSKGKRSSILKKQFQNEHDDAATGPSSNAYKGAKKIGFHRKMSIKEFTIGENTETIWGNSYEVSTDSTSPRVVCDDTHTLNNASGSTSNHPETLLLQEENKENVTLVGTNRMDPSLDVPMRTSPNNSISASNSWDLSITIADDEKRRMRSESMLNCSQSLNMTERLLMEPIQPSSKRRSSGEVLAMDVSPLKPPVTMSASSRSPRKMMYYNPKQGVTVQISDVPYEQEQPAARGLSSNYERSYKRSMPCDRSETWNSHPQAMFQLSALRPSNEGLTDMSSDFDNTIAITNTVEKLLKDGANLTLTVPTNMELDDSATVTDVKLPTNALARARPSFLPSQNRQQDMSQDEEEYVESMKVPAKTDHANNPTTVRPLNETESMQTTSVAPQNTFGGNLSLSFEDIQQPVINKSASVSRGNKSDFKISSLSLGLSPNSPEIVNTGRLKVFRPTLPATLFDTATKTELSKRTLLEDGPSERSAISRQTLHTPIEMDETRAYAASGAKPKQSNLVPVSMETVAKEPSSRSYRATVYETNDMIDGDEEQPPGMSAPRATIMQRQTMELSKHSPPVTKSKHQPIDSSVFNANRRSVYAQQPMDESIVEKPARESRDLQRATKHDRMTMLESSPVSVRGRNTLYPNEPMVQDADIEAKIRSQCAATVPRNTRQTIVNNDSMVMDNPEPRVSAISCGFYGENLDAVSIHAESETHVMDLTVAARTTKHVQPSEPYDAKSVYQSRPTTIMTEECMRLSEVYAPQHPQVQHSNVYTTMPMEEEERNYVTMGCEKNVGQQWHSKSKSRVSTYQSIAMDQTKIAEGEHCSDTTHATDHSKNQLNNRSRPTTHLIEEMETMRALKDQCAPTDHMSIVTRFMQSSQKDRHDAARQLATNSPVLSSVSDSPMDMSSTVVVDPIPMTRKADERSMLDAKLNTDKTVTHSVGPSQRSRHSIYQPLDMEHTLPSVSSIESPKKRATVQTARSLELRKSILQKIVHQTPIEDMEGISLLADDEDLRAVQTSGPMLTKANRTTMHFIDDAAQIVEETMVARSDDQLTQAAPVDVKVAVNRQTIYEPQAMERETIIITSAFRGSSKMVEAREPSPMDVKDDRGINRQTIYEPQAMERETNIIPSAFRGSSKMVEAREPSPMDVKDDRGINRQTIYEPQAMEREANIMSSAFRGSSKMVEPSEPSYGEPIVRIQNSNEDRRKQRQTICEAVAMEEETNSYEPLAMVGTTEKFGNQKPNVEISKSRHDRAADRQTIYDLHAMQEEAVVASSDYRASRGTVPEKLTGYDEPIVLMNSKEDHAKRHRQTIYDAHAMEEETSIMPIVHRTAHSRKENEVGSAQRSSSVTSQQRKSSVCMEETVALLPVRRIERNDAPEDGLSESPILQLQRKRETIYPTDDTMEITLGAAENKAPEKKQQLANRQTEIQPAYIETTLLHDHSPAAGINEASAYRNPLTHHLSDKPMEKSSAFQQEQLTHETPVLAKRQTFSRSRQTILLAQDMDVEDAEEDTMEGRVKEENSFAFPKLARETTEDCAMRCAPPVKLVRGREGFSDVLGEPYGMPKRSTTIARMENSAIGYSQIINGVAQEEERQLYSHHAPDRIHSASIYQESIDISMARSLLATEPPQIDNISGHYMSMQDVTEPLAVAKQPAAATKENASISVIRHGSTTMEPEPLQSVMVAATVAGTASDDEFHDAEDELVNDPLSLTKSRLHLLQSMKFVDVEQMERTGVATSSKRVHANVRSSSSTVGGLVRDPLHVTVCQQQQQQQQQEDPHPSTPQGPLMKKKRVSNSPASPTVSMMPVMQQLDETLAECNDAEAAAHEQYNPPECESIPDSRATALIDGRRSVINDPSVFLIDDDDDLLEDESQLPSFTEEQLTAQKATQEDQQGNATPDESPSVKRFFRPLNDLSYYREFANLTLNEWYEEDQPEQPEQVEQQKEQPAGPAENVVADCITISDDSLTAPMANLTVAQRRSSALSEGGVLNSTIADEFMEELMAKLPRQTKHPCCGSNNDCLCRLRRQLERQRKKDEREWQLFDKHISSIQVPKSSAFDQRFEELCWQMDDLEEDLSSILETAMTMRKEREERSAEGNMDEIPELGTWRLSGGSTFPEIPNVVFLYENLRRCLQEQPRVDDSPPAGAHLPRVPHITLLVANKLATEHKDSGWCLDISEEALFDHLLFRHRTISSFYVSVQLQPVQAEQPGSSRKTTRPGVPREEDRYIERIQVETTDAFEAFSPMRYLLHVEFMRLTMATTEQTLRSKYRTIGSLMGLWRHFSELYECAVRNVQRLLTIVENGDAFFTYDSKTEQFCVKKWFQRHQDTATGSRLASNVLQVHFSTINGIAPSGVRFNRPFDGAHDLLSSVTVGPANDPGTGPMFLECLLWRLMKLHQESAVSVKPPMPGA